MTMGGLSKQLEDLVHVAGYIIWGSLRLRAVVFSSVRIAKTLFPTFQSTDCSTPFCIPMIQAKHSTPFSL